MTGRGEFTRAGRDPIALTLQFVSDGTFQITGYIHSHRQMKQGREEGEEGGEGEDGEDGGHRNGSERGSVHFFPPLSFLNP